MKQHKKAKFSFQVSILFLTVSLLLLFGGVLSTIAFRGSVRAAQAMAERLIRQNKDFIVNNTTANIRLVNRTLQASINMEIFGAFDDDILLKEREKYFVDILEDSPALSNFYLGREDGSFFKVSRMPDESFSFLSLQQEGDSFNYLWIHENEEWYTQYPSQTVSKSDAENYKNQPWYREAKEKNRTVWSDLYIFEDDEEPGISCSMPIISTSGEFIGVVGTDANMAGISKIMAKNRVLDANIIAITYNNDIVGKTTTFTEHPFAIREENSLRPLNIKDLEGNVLAEAVRRHRANQEKQNDYNATTIESFKFEGERNLAFIAPLPPNLPWDWDIGVVVERAAFFKESRIIALRILVVSILLLGGAIIIAVLFSHSISIPIRKLTTSTNCIREFDLTYPPRLKTRIKEIHEMVENYTQMVRGLRSFRKYVPANLVKRLILTEKEAVIGGFSRELTIFFSDITEFTALSEKIPPTRLLNELSVYLSKLSKIIVSSGGTIDKYSGDGIMAFWGAPEEEREHAVKACQAALACYHALLKETTHASGNNCLAMPTRFGLHSGEVVVGNVGSEERMDYTVLGDSVNLASRLETLNKFYGTKIIISENTYQQVKEQMEVRPLDFVIVKGKSKPIHIYELLAAKGELTAEAKERADLFTKSFKLYRKRKFKEAEQLFAQICQQDKSDKPAAIYLERCRSMQENPPPPNWDGTFQMKTK